MQRSKAEIYLHFVWATRQRLPLIDVSFEQALYACIISQVKTCQCEVLAIGGIQDHVHLLVKTPTTITASQLMQQVKGVSSTVVRERLAPGRRLDGRMDTGCLASADRM